MSFSTFIVRNLLFVFNLISAFAGLGLLDFGVITIYNLDGIVPERFEGAIYAAPILCITIGSIIFFIAFLGCCGAIKNTKCMLIMYAVIILCIVVIQIAAVVMAFMQVKDSKTVTALYMGMKKAFDTKSKPKLLEKLKADLYN